MLAAERGYSPPMPKPRTKRHTPERRLTDRSVDNALRRPCETQRAQMPSRRLAPARRLRHCPDPLGTVGFDTVARASPQRDAQLVTRAYGVLGRGAQPLSTPAVNNLPYASHSAEHDYQMSRFLCKLRPIKPASRGELGVGRPALGRVSPIRPSNTGLGQGLHGAPA